MPLSRFHPLIERWFRETLGEPTAAQRLGWAAIREGRHTLIAAPTGSGKTLAAFLSALDDLFVEGLTAPLPDEVRVVYVSPLKALSADIHKNLAEPRAAIRRLARELGLEDPHITAAVRTGDTTQSERAAMLKTPPHILVTTPESLYLLLTAERSREMLRTARTVIVDEIHAVIGTRRGAHLALTLERLQQIVDTPLLRLGLSATQKPIEEVARFLVGTNQTDCAIVDEGHRRAMDLALELPRSPLETVMSHEVWEEYYDRITNLIEGHRTTLIFVNTRRMAERVARHLSDRLGDEAVTAHHGSLSKDKRLDAENRLKSGGLKALVATASLELGIDIGHVDLVCQIGSPHRISTFLQRVGRSGHTVSGLPKGKLFPVSRDDLVECVALLRSVGKGELDRIVTHDAPLDVLAQQIVAETSCQDYSEEELFALVRRAWPYRELKRHDFDQVLQMGGDGFATRRGRRSALLHRDEVNGAVRGRRGSRMLAITSGGAIPEVADYRVVLEPDDTFIGTLNEDFAIESSAGDIFQLGNSSWQITQVGSGIVRVSDAKGAPPTIPFWLGEAPARSDELSLAVSDLRGDTEKILDAIDKPPVWSGRPRPPLEPEKANQKPETRNQKRAGEGSVLPSSGRIDSAIEWLMAEAGVGIEAAREVIEYLVDARRSLGALPTQKTIVLERFFDESGGMQLVLHVPFGSRINKAWGLALRKRFCRQFNFELQAAATEDAVLLSLGPQHSFPLADVFRYLHPATTRDVLVQAFLDAPVFQTRWRWNTTISLAIPRNRGGRKIPPQLQRSMADDLMAAVFPDAAACLENVAGDRKLPDHPLVNQAVRDCLEEAMDYEGLAAILERIHSGEIRCLARDTPEPSALSHEILNARPYAFLDDAPLEERRTQAVYARRSGDASSADDLGALDVAAIERVRDEAWPDPRDADELHDALLTAGFLTAEEVSSFPRELLDRLVDTHRAGPLTLREDASITPRIPVVGAACGRRHPDGELAPLTLWTAAERLPELLAMHPFALVTPDLVPPSSRTSRTWNPEEATVELLRGRMAIIGPTTARELAGSLGIPTSNADAALLSLESEGAVLRGSFTPRVERLARGEEPGELEWCDRRLLARIHRYTLNRLRSEIEPVTAADFMRFLFRWQHVTPPARLTGIDGLQAVIGLLDGFEIAADGWERAVLRSRVERYEESLLDMLCLTGEVGWARLSPPSTGGLPSLDAPSISRLVGATPIALFLREHADAWQALRSVADEGPSAFLPDALSETARKIAELLLTRGASFLRELGVVGALDPFDVRRGIGELVSAGLVASDGFAGLRSLVKGTSERASREHRGGMSGRWSLVGSNGEGMSREEAVEIQARVLLRRYGVVFRRLLTRESIPASWRELTRVYRRLEARGEIRGGRFVAGMSGEQFASAEAVEKLREIRREGADGKVIVINAVDPLNLVGILTTGERVRAVVGNRIAYRDGFPLSVIEGDSIRPLAESDPAIALEVASALAGRRVGVASGYVGRPA